MSGLYLPGMEMPTEGELIAIRPDGKAYFIAANPKDACETEVVPVPDHGDLIDKDAICNECRRVSEEYDGIYPDCQYCPVPGTAVIPADPDKEGDE